MRAVAFKPQPVGADEVFAVERAVDLEKLRQPPGAFRAFHAANEHRLGTPFRPRHDVQHFVHPVAEVDVGAAARRVHHVRPRRAPLVRMAGRVLLAAVRLGFGNAPPNDRTVVETTAKPRADKRSCHRHRINRIIFRSQSMHFIVMGCSFEIPTRSFMGCSFSSFRFDSCAAMDAIDWLAFGDGAIARAVLLVKRIAVRYCNALSTFRTKKIVIGHHSKTAATAPTTISNVTAIAAPSVPPIKILQQTNATMASTMKTMPNLQYSLNFLKSDFISRLFSFPLSVICFLCAGICIFPNKTKCCFTIPFTNLCNVTACTSTTSTNCIQGINY